MLSAPTIHQIFAWIARSRTEWLILLAYEAIVLLIILYGCHILEVTVLDRGEQFWIPDLEFGWSNNALRALLRGFRDDGRLAYLGIMIFDTFLYSHGYRIIIASWLQWASTPVGHDKKAGISTIMKAILMLPLLTWIADIIENMALVYCTVSFLDGLVSPMMWEAVASTGCVYNRIKWILFVFSLVAAATLSMQKLSRSRVKTD